jgi:hypothetical protein
MKEFPEAISWRIERRPGTPRPGLSFRGSFDISSRRVQSAVIGFVRSWKQATSRPLPLELYGINMGVFCNAHCTLRLASGLCGLRTELG